MEDEMFPERDLKCGTMSEMQYYERNRNGCMEVGGGFYIFSSFCLICPQSAKREFTLYQLVTGFGNALLKYSSLHNLFGRSTYSERSQWKLLFIRIGIEYRPLGEREKWMHSSDKCESPSTSANSHINNWRQFKLWTIVWVWTSLKPD